MIDPNTKKGYIKQIIRSAQLYLAAFMYCPRFPKLTIKTQKNVLTRYQTEQFHSVVQQQQNSIYDSNTLDENSQAD
jgi:hypothetical protein